MRSEQLEAVSTELKDKSTIQYAGGFEQNIIWSGIKDSNLRPRGPKPRALPTAPIPVVTEGDYTA
jgi:hypothetical protein